MQFTREYSKGGGQLLRKPERIGRRLLAYSTVAFGLALTGNCADFCAVRLSVTLPNGNRVSSGHVELIDPLGNVVRRTDFVDGHAELCDFGFGLHSIRVSKDGFLPVVISGIRLVYQEAQELRIVLNAGHNVGTGISAGIACMAYVRVMGTEGAPLTGVRATNQGFVYESDSYGRMGLLVPLKSFADFRFEKAGFQARTISLGCGDLTSGQLERAVYLVADTGK